MGDGLDAYQPIGLIADPSRLTVVANVLETDIYDVSVGQAVTIKLDAYPNRSLSGQVSQIPLRPIAWQGKNAYEVVLAFDDPANLPATVRQGADVSISAQSKPDVLWIPANAIMTKSGQSYVELVQDNGASTLVMVQLGVSDGTRTEVVTYLREGDTVKLP